MCVFVSVFVYQISCKSDERKEVSIRDSGANLHEDIYRQTSYLSARGQKTIWYSWPNALVSLYKKFPRPIWSLYCKTNYIYYCEINMQQVLLVIDVKQEWVIWSSKNWNLEVFQSGNYGPIIMRQWAGMWPNQIFKRETITLDCSWNDFTSEVGVF